MSITRLQQQIAVHALPSKVWKVLTNSQYINQYLSDGNVSSGWTEGSAIIVSQHMDKEEPVAIGHVLESIPGILLKFTYEEGERSVRTIITYELILAGDGVELKMKCEGFSAAQQEYILRVQQANLLLQKIKWLSEYS